MFGLCSLYKNIDFVNGSVFAVIAPFSQECYDATDLILYKERSIIMKRNCYTRLMALLLAVVMLLAMTACSEGAVSETAAQTSEPSAAAPETPETPDAPETSQEDAPLASAEETVETANIFPLEETETFSLYYPWSPRFVELGYSSPNDFTFFPALEALTNVHIDFTAVGADVFSENFLLMMATQDYTDMYFNCTASYNGGISKAIEDGAWIDLSDLVAENAPNYTALMASDPDFYRANYTDEGALGQFMQYYENSFNNGGMMVRQDWLTALGLDVPETYDDWYNVLSAFTREYGLQNSIISSTPTSGYYTQTDTGFIVDDGKVVNVWSDKEYAVPWITEAKKWYEAGIFSSSALVENGIPDQEGRSMVLSGEVGIFSVDIDLIHVYEEQMADSGYVGTPIPRPVVEAGSIPYDATQSEFGHGITISSACENPELAVQWMDFWYSEEVQLLANYGIENDTFTYDEAGTPHFTDKVLDDEDGLNFALFKYVVDWGPTVLDWNRKLDSYTDTQLDAMEVWKKVDSSNGYPSYATFTTEESNIISQYYTDVQTIVDEQQPKFIMGEKSMDEFDAYVETLKSAGLDQVIECYQAAYDRYMAR